MRVTILGAGAIGGLLGGMMAKAGADVVLVDRWAEHVEAINRDGLRVDGIRGDFVLRPRVITPDALRGPLGAVVVATKAMDAEDAARAVAPLLGEDGFLVSLQNGLFERSFEAILADAGLRGQDRIVGAIPNYGAGLIGPGHIEFVHEGPIQLGEMNGARSARLETLAALFSALTPVEISRDIWAQVWAKEVYNNQVVCSALANAPLRETLGDERIARMAGALVREAIGIARANGVAVEPFSFFDPSLYDPRAPAETRRLVLHIQETAWKLRKDQARSAHLFRKTGSGTWWDIKVRKRRSEVSWRNGRLVALGRAAGAETILTEKLVAMIGEIERGERDFSFANYDELEAFIASSGRALPWTEHATATGESVPT